MKENNNLHIGIDVGSTASKCVIMKDGQEIVAKSLVPVGTGTSGPARAIAEVLDNAKMTREQMDFVLATGSSNTQINALVDNVEKVLHEEAEEEPLHREGYRGGTWVLMDFGSLVVHVFTAEARKFYDLERLWQDGHQVNLAAVLGENA